MKIIIAILVFSFLMIIHELGHFLMARKLGIRAYELSIGMGPKLLGKKIGDTHYNVRAIPFGAYVRFGDEEDEFFSEPDNFMNQSPWNRIKVILMGPFVNLVAALLLIIAVIFFSGFPTSVIAAVNPGYPAAEAGIVTGDSIIEVNGTTTKDWGELVSELQRVKPDAIVHLVVEKADGTQKPVDLQMKEYEGRYMLGISPVLKKDFFKSIQYGTLSTIQQSSMMLDVLSGLFTGKAKINDFTGPVGIVTVVGEAAQAGWKTLLGLTALLSLNLGILNLLPIPGLDGSKILLYTYEGIRGKPINREMETRITIAGFLLIIAFSVFITYKDIMRIVLK